VGKLTIGEAICRETGAGLIDNHLIANPVFAAAAIDRGGALPPSVKQKVAIVRRAVLAAMVEDAAPAASFVLTDVLLDDASSEVRYADVETAAAAREASFVPVILRCTEDTEYALRVTDPARVAKLKQTDLAISLGRRSTKPLLPISHRNLLEIEVGSLSASEAAADVIAHVAGLAR